MVSATATSLPVETVMLRHYCRGFVQLVFASNSAQQCAGKGIKWLQVSAHVSEFGSASSVVFVTLFVPCNAGKWLGRRQWRLDAVLRRGFQRRGRTRRGRAWGSRSQPMRGRTSATETTHSASTSSLVKLLASLEHVRPGSFRPSADVDDGSIKRVGSKPRAAGQYAVNARPPDTMNTIWRR